MNILRQPTIRAAMVAVLCSFFLLAADTVRSQSGPPMPPTIFLDYYSFLQTNFDSDYGYAPIGESNVFSVADWGGNALWLDTTNESPAYIHYNLVETNGQVNIQLGTGAILALVTPDWASADTNQLGHGPGARGYLLASGDFSGGSPEGLWAIYVDAGGTNIYFGGVSNSVTNIYVSAPISWATNSLHMIGVYYQTNTELYLDGQRAATGGPVTIVPATNTWTNGFYVGSEASGYDQFRGIFLYLEMDTTNVFLVSTNYLTWDWSWYTNQYYTWLDGSGGEGGFHPDGSGGFGFPPPPTNTYNSNFLAYTNFWLSITNTGDAAQVDLINPCRGLTYVIFTNSQVQPLTSTNWQPWVIMVGSNTVMSAPSITPTSNTLFFCAELIWETGTNSLPDWWQLMYFNTLNVNPYADPDGDGLCNLDEYLLGLNPTNAHTLSSAHTDAQAEVLAYTNSTGCVYHLAITNGPNTNTLLVTMSPTVVGTNYQIYSQTCSNCAWIVETNFLGTNTSTTVAICLNGRTLSLIGGYGEDSDGDLLPDGYEVLATHTDPYLPDTGLTGTPDTYKDPDGDGYVNIVELQNGTDPLVFNTPAGPLNVVLDPGTATNTYNLIWQPAAGEVLGYVISALNNANSEWVTLYTNSPTQLSYVLTNASFYEDGYGLGALDLLVQAIYAGGTSSAISAAIGGPLAMATATLTYGPGGHAYLITSAANTNVTGYNVVLSYYGVNYPSVATYYQDPTLYSPTFPSSFYVPASQFTNGIAVLSDTQIPPYSYVDEELGVPFLYPATAGNSYSAATVFENGGFQWFYAEPFIDGTTAMKQNIRFLLRVADYAPFGYYLNPNADGYSMSFPQNYVFSSYYYGDEAAWWLTGRAVDYFAPFEDNYFYCNFVFNSSLVNNNGYLETGFSYWDLGDELLIDTVYVQTNNPQFEFPTYNYVASNLTTIPVLLASNEIPWVGYMGGEIGEFGAYTSGSSLAMSSGTTNLYGLAYSSLKLTMSNSGGIYYSTLSPTNNVSGYDYLPFYAGTVEPELQTVGYYFANAAKDPLPEDLDGSFAVTNTTPFMVGSVGASMIVAGYAKQELLNGNTNVFAYLGQYFTNAFVVSNGVVSTNLTGILSEYGEFFPVVPGQVALVTKPDPDQSNLQGTNFVDIIRLSLDVNHDGIMDESFTGPDNTSYYMPFSFWVNNNYDRWTTDILDGSTSFEDDVATNSSAANSLYTGLPVPDYEYRDANGHRIIPCPRDLEDFARLWVSGISSNVLTNLPSGSTVTLSWAGIGTSPTIDIFQAADADGGIGYQTNLTTASNQINTNICQYVGRLGPGGSIQLNSSTFSNNWAGDHFIWCGAWYGSDQLNLTITDGSGNVLAQSSQYIQIVDIKQMYERWTIGDNDNNEPLATVTPMSNAVPAQDNFSPGSPQQSFQYSYDPAYDTNDNYILYVHGWNEKDWRKDRWAETAYKRLYWQGYQGRFGEFRWPCFNLSANLAGYDTSEWNAWKSGQSLETFLAKTLNKNYPNHVYVLAHSQGNVVVGEALRLATNQVVNTYVASQGALSARGYDNTLPTNAASYYTITTSDPQGHYYTNGAPSYFSASAGSGKYVNFYNPNDYALMGDSLNLYDFPNNFNPGWILDQSLKPDLGEGYHYTTPGGGIPSGYYLQASFYQTVAPTVYPLYFPTNTYQIFAMGAQSYSLALGAQVGVRGSFSTNLQVNLSAAPYNFGRAHIQHDQQFTFDNMTTAPYWQELLETFGLQN